MGLINDYGIPLLESPYHKPGLRMTVDKLKVLVSSAPPQTSHELVAGIWKDTAGLAYGRQFLKVGVAAHILAPAAQSASAGGRPRPCPDNTCPFDVSSACWHEHRHCSLWKLLTGTKGKSPASPQLRHNTSPAGSPGLVTLLVCILLSFLLCHLG